MTSLARALLMAATTAAVHTACSVPEPIESGATSCHDRIDDDAKSGPDCEDPACASVCETSEATCTDGIDDDDDGLVDCEDRDCRSTAACAPVDAPCDAWTNEGCSSRLTCFETNPFGESRGSYCAVAGDATMGDPCNIHEDCSQQHLCVAHRCIRRCEDQLDCPRGSTCGKDLHTGICPLPCIPRDGDDACSPGRCRPIEGAIFGEVPQLFFCDDSPPFVGLLPEGADCHEYDPLDSKPEERCALPAACVAELGLPFGSGRCRDACGLDHQGAVVIGCPRPDRTCRPAFPDDPREPLAGRLELGICIPEGR